MKKQLETNISASIGKLYKDIAGRGPKLVKTKIFEDMIIIRFFNYSAPVYEALLHNEVGQDLLGKQKRIIFDCYKHQAKNMITEMVQVDVKEMYYDQNTKSEENVVVVILQENIEQKLNLE